MDKFTTTNPTSVTISNNDGVPYVLAQKLSIGYANEVIVPDMNFELGKGEAFALIGTNGSGKSTLLKTVVGLLHPLNGQITVFGQAPGSNPKRIAYLGQFHHSGFILPLRVIDVVRMGLFPKYGLLKPRSRDDEIVVHSAMHTMGIENLSEAPLRSLSGGQQQRTYLAQVLAHTADLLVLDEPTAGLDAGGRELYLQAINDELCRGASVLVATHDIREEAALCKSVMLLAHKVIAYGPPQEVLKPETLLEAFGIVVTGGEHIQVLECQHHDEETVHTIIDVPRS